MGSLLAAVFRSSATLDDLARAANATLSLVGDVETVREKLA